MFIKKLIKTFGYNEPIFANEILELFDNYTKSYIYRLINQEMKEENLFKYSQGVYYIPNKSDFGLSTITARDVVYKKYIYQDGKYSGFYSGLSLANEFKLTNQLPNKIEIITNKETTRLRKININGFQFILRKSRLKINNKNVYTYKLLELITENDMQSFNEESVCYINKYIECNGITKGKIDCIIDAFPSKAVKKARILIAMLEFKNE